MRRPGVASTPSSRGPTRVPSLPPDAEWYSRGYLPHCEAPGAVQMLTFRLGDALPALAVEQMRADPTCRTDDARWERLQAYLDAGHGACYLRDRRIATLVENALLWFDGERYRLLAWSVMPIEACRTGSRPECLIAALGGLCKPQSQSLQYAGLSNHVHTLIETSEGHSLERATHSWKSYTSSEANKMLGRRGVFWQKECFDRYMRSMQHFEATVAYIDGNASWFSSARRIHGDREA